MDESEPSEKKAKIEESNEEHSETVNVANLQEESAVNSVKVDVGYEPPQCEMQKELIVEEEQRNKDVEVELNEVDLEAEEAVKHIELKDESDETGRKMEEVDTFKETDGEGSENLEDSGMPEAMRVEDSHENDLDIEQSPPSLTPQMDPTEDDEPCVNIQEEPHDLERMSPDRADPASSPQCVGHVASPESVESTNSIASPSTSQVPIQETSIESEEVPQSESSEPQTSVGEEHSQPEETHHTADSQYTEGIESSPGARIPSPTAQSPAPHPDPDSDEGPDEESSVASPGEAEAENDKEEELEEDGGEEAASGDHPQHEVVNLIDSEDEEKDEGDQVTETKKNEEDVESRGDDEVADSPKLDSVEEEEEEEGEDDCKRQTHASDEQADETEQHMVSVVASVAAGHTADKAPDGQGSVSALAAACSDSDSVVSPEQNYQEFNGGETVCQTLESAENLQLLDNSFERISESNQSNETSSAAASRDDGGSTITLTRLGKAAASHQSQTCGPVYSHSPNAGTSLTQTQSLPPAPPMTTNTLPNQTANRGFGAVDIDVAHLSLESPTSINSGEMTNSSVETTPSQTYSDCAQVQNNYCPNNINNSPGNYMDTVMTSPVTVQMNSPSNSQQNFSIPNPSPSNSGGNFNMHNPSPSNNTPNYNMPMPSPNSGSSYNMPIPSPSSQNAANFSMPMPSPTANTSNNFNMPNPSPNNTTNTTYTSMPTPSPTNSNHSFNMATPSPTATGHTSQNFNMQSTQMPNPPMQNTPMPNPPMQNSPMHNPPMQNPTMATAQMPNNPMPNPPMANAPMPNPPMQPGPMSNMGMQPSNVPTSVHVYQQCSNTPVNVISSYGPLPPQGTQRLVHSSHGQPSSCQMGMGPGAMGPGGMGPGGMGPGGMGGPRPSYSNNTSCSLAKLQQLTNGIMDIVPDSTMTPPPNLTPPPMNMTPPPSMQRNVTPPILQPQVSSAGGAMHAYAQKHFHRRMAAQGKSPNVTVNPNKVQFTPNVTLQPGTNVIRGYNLVNSYRMAQQPIMNTPGSYITNPASFINQPQLPMQMGAMMNMHPQATANFQQQMQPAQANNAVYTTYGYGPLTPQAFNMNVNMNSVMRR